MTSFSAVSFYGRRGYPYSVGRELEKGKSRQSLLWRVIKRGLILVLLGIVANNGLKIMPISEVRFPSVLGRIGLAYMFANIIYLYTKERAQMIWFWALIIGYWLLLKFTSAPASHPAILPWKAILRLMSTGCLFLAICISAFTIPKD